jgi:hypothetical protein
MSAFSHATENLQARCGDKLSRAGGRVSSRATRGIGREGGADCGTVRHRESAAEAATQLPNPTLRIMSVRTNGHDLAADYRTADRLFR